MNRIEIARVEEILHAMEGVRVLVVGDLMLDRYITGNVDRISPEAPVPVVRVESESSALGGAANVAANVLALGAGCVVAGCVGNDPLGRVLTDELVDQGVGIEGVVRTEGRPTTVKTRVMARHQQVVRVDQEDDGDLSPEMVSRLVEKLNGLAEASDALVMEDYNKGVLVPRVIQAAKAAASGAGLPTVVDPKRLHFFEYGDVTVFKPNAKELSEALTAHLRPDDGEWMRATRDRLGCGNLLLTLGEHGMALLTAEDDFVRVPTVARDVYDVSGAGDTVTAVVATALSAGATALEAAILANHAAAVEVGKLGVAVVSPEEILQHCIAFHRD